MESDRARPGLPPFSVWIWRKWFTRPAVQASWDITPAAAAKINAC